MISYFYENSSVALTNAGPRLLTRCQAGFYFCRLAFVFISDLIEVKCGAAITSERWKAESTDSTSMHQSWAEGETDRCPQ